MYVATFKNPDVFSFSELFNADGTLVIRLNLSILYWPFLSLNILFHLFISVATVRVIIVRLISLLTNVILIIHIFALQTDHTPCEGTIAGEILHVHLITPLQMAPRIHCNIRFLLSKRLSHQVVSLSSV